MEQIYRIELTVPLGIRQGQMRYTKRNDQVQGTLEVLGSVTTFCGTERESTLVIDGVLKTSVREIRYHGVGSVQNGKLQMQLQGPKEVYKLTGYLKKI